MNDLQKNIYKVIVSIIETDGILERFEDKKNYGQDKIIDNSAISYAWSHLLTRIGEYITVISNIISDCRIKTKVISNKIGYGGVDKGVYIIWVKNY